MQKTGGCRPISESAKRHLLTPTQLAATWEDQMRWVFWTRWLIQHQKRALCTTIKHFCSLQWSSFVSFVNWALVLMKTCRQKWPVFSNSQTADKSCSATQQSPHILCSWCCFVHLVEDCDSLSPAQETVLSVASSKERKKLVMGCSWCKGSKRHSRCKSVVKPSLKMMEGILLLLFCACHGCMLWKNKELKVECETRVLKASSWVQNVSEVITTLHCKICLLSDYLKNWSFSSAYFCQN